jgi:hypothetical protein
MREEVHTERIIGGAFGMQIKKMTSLVLAAMISLSLAACGSSQTTAATSGQTSQQEVNAQSADSSGAKNAESAQDEGKAEVQQTEAAAKNESSVGKNILILYFSADNTRDVDAVSSATPMADGTSSVEWIATIIHENVGGDLIAIIPSEDYPLEYDALADYAKKERDDGGRPAFEDLGVDPASCSSWISKRNNILPPEALQISIWAGRHLQKTKASWGGCSENTEKRGVFFEEIDYTDMLSASDHNSGRICRDKSSDAGANKAK